MIPIQKKIRVKKWSQFKHPDSEYACKSWGSCGEGGGVADLKAKIKCKTDFDAAKAARDQKLSTWKNDPQKNSGLYNAPAISVCEYSSPAISEWFFKGNSLGAPPDGETRYLAEVAKACGIERTNAVNDAKSRTEGFFQYTGSSPECSVTTYICSGVDVGIQKMLTMRAKEPSEKACEGAEERWTTSGINGKFSEPGCEVKWQCNKEVFTTESDFLSSSCGKPAPAPAPPPWLGSPTPIQRPPCVPSIFRKCT